jgi:CRISPR-associated endonuclease/helicase Cas3
VDLKFIKGANTYDDIANEIAKYHKVLCIVNTRKDAKELFDRLPKNGLCLHLSRMMCPAHVEATIRQIKDALKHRNDGPIRVVATQLIEAGVDIDFPVVYRQEAGLDSILQAAGRCNREGKQKICTTYVFSLGKEHPLPPGFISQTNSARIGMGECQDWFAPEAMTRYFSQLHSRIDNFDEKQIQKLLYKPECEFEEAARQFHLIDDQTTSVIINWNGSMELYQQLKSQGPSYSLMKKLARYSVNIRKRDFSQLNNIGAIEEPFENIYAITNPSFYRSDTGLTMDNQWLEETYII